MAVGLHETVLRLFPDSPYAKEHCTEAPKCKSYEATAASRKGEPGNLGAVRPTCHIKIGAELASRPFAGIISGR